MDQCRCSFVVELRRSPLEFLVNYRSSIFLGSKLDITIVLFFQVVWRRGTKTARQDAPDPRLRSQVCLFTVCSPTGNHDTKCSALTVTSRCLRPRARLGVGTGSAGRLRVGHIPRRVVAHPAALMFTVKTVGGLLPQARLPLQHIIGNLPIIPRRDLG